MVQLRGALLEGDTLVAGVGDTDGGGRVGELDAGGLAGPDGDEVGEGELVGLGAAVDLLGLGLAAADPVVDGDAEGVTCPRPLAESELTMPVVMPVTVPSTAPMSSAVAIHGP